MGATKDADDAKASAAEAGDVEPRAAYSAPAAITLDNTAPSGLSSASSGPKRAESFPVQISLVTRRALARASMWDTSFIMATMHGDDEAAKKAIEGVAAWPEISVHLVTTMLGAGVLSLPYAFACLGWTAGVLLLTAVTSASAYCAWLMATMHELKDGSRTETMNELALATMGRWGQRYAIIFQFFILILSCISFMVLGGESIYSLVYGCFGETAAECHAAHAQWPFVLTFAGAMMILGQLPNFHSLTVVSLIGSFMPVAYTLVACISILVGSKEEGVSYSRLTGNNNWESGMYFLQGMGSLLFSFGGQVVQNEVTATLSIPPPLKQSMRKALTLTYSVIAACYFLMSGIGFGYYGNSANGNILNNVPYKVAAYIANAGVLLHVGAGFQVLSMPVFMEAEKLIRHWGWGSGRAEWVVRLVWRTSYIALLCLLGALIPFFAQLGGLVGGLGVLPLCYIMPLLMWSMYNRGTASRLRQGLHYGASVVLAGTAACISIASVYWIAQAAKTFQVFP